MKCMTDTGDIFSTHTERKSRFMKWMGKLLKGGSNRGSVNGGSSSPQFSGDHGSMVLRAPVRSSVNMVSLPRMLFGLVFVYVTVNVRICLG